MKQYDLLEAWKDLVGLFGAEVAPALVVDAPNGASRRETWVRIPSRSGWKWRSLGTKRDDSHMHIEVTLEHERSGEEDTRT
ncbi:MAG: hypothetical protein SGI72_01190 [Planctomycetota bacterium]|nr:hypothetical protein [Planctomycetota bacterium]